MFGPVWQAGIGHGVGLDCGMTIVVSKFAVIGILMERIITDGIITMDSNDNNPLY